MSGSLEDLVMDNLYEKPTRCSKCGKLLTYVGVGEYKCSECGFTEYDAYGLVRAFVEKNPGANVVQVERATGVSKKVISGLVKAGKLEIRNSSGKILEV